MNTPQTVLLADDDPAIRKFLRQVLHKAGYQVLVATNGREVMTMLQTERQPDLLLLDLMMPESTGLDVIEKVREFPQPIPVILMSAVDLPPVHKMVLLASPTPYLIKPFQPQELLTRIENVLAAANVN